jgi:hypothetical protein
LRLRIGDRDSTTGLYQVIWPDGSSTLNGIKIFNATHEVGDPVLAARRSDGMMILDSVKAVDVAATEIGVEKFGEQPIGYLRGQVFNIDEDEVKIPTVYVGFALGSPQSLVENSSESFVIRLRIEQAQRKNLEIRCQASGVFGYFTSTLVVNNTDNGVYTSTTILAGRKFVDVEIHPIPDIFRSYGGDIVFTVNSGEYKVSQNRELTMTVLEAGPFIFFEFLRIISGSLQAAPISSHYVITDLDTRTLRFHRTDGYGQVNEFVRAFFRVSGTAVLGVDYDVAYFGQTAYWFPNEPFSSILLSNGLVDRKFGDAIVYPLKLEGKTIEIEHIPDTPYLLPPINPTIITLGGS